MAFDQHGLESLLAERSGGGGERMYGDAEIQVMVEHRLEAVFHAFESKLRKIFKPVSQADHSHLNGWKQETLRRAESNELLQDFYELAGFGTRDQLVAEMIHLLAPQLLADARRSLNVDRARMEQVMEMVEAVGWGHISKIIRGVLLQQRAVHSALQPTEQEKSQVVA